MTRSANRRYPGAAALLLFLLVSLQGQAAHAVSSYLNSFNTRYATSATRLNSCTLCHTSVPSLNPYGSAYLNAGHNFATIEPADSDGDGSSNLVEIRALTFPGDPNDRPAPPAGSPTLSVAPPTASFGSVTVGLASAPVVETLTNGGTASLSVSAMTLSDTANFTLDVNGGTNPCGAAAKTLAPGAGCTVAVSFAPKTAGARSGSLTLASNDPAGARVVSLSGTGLAAPVAAVAVTPGTDAFGTIAVGAVSPPIVSTIASTGTASLSVSSISLSNATDFSLDLSGGAAPCGSAAKTLAPGTSCTVAVSFAPKTAGARSGSLNVASNAAANPVASVSLSGSGAAAAAPKVAVAPASVACGTVTVGASSAPRSVTVSNAGTANLVLGALSLSGTNGADFGLQNDRCSSRTLAPGGSCTVEVVFSPSAAAAMTASLAVPSNDSATPRASVPVTGTGIASADTAPSVVSTTPASGAASVPAGSTVGAVFSETMAASSINASTFTLSSAAGAVTGTVTASGTSATFTPSAPLAAGTQYTATVTTGVKDLSGLPLAAPYRWSFTVAAAAGGSGEDSDGDGVEDDEDAYPHDNRHATPGSPRRHGRIHVDVSTVFGAYLTETRAFGENLGGIVQAGRPEGYHFEDGLVSFRINGGTVTGRGEMRITYPSVVPAGSRVYVVTPSGFQEVAGAKISGDTVTVPVGSESSAVKGLLVGGSGAAPASIVGVASPDAAPSPSAGGGCSASGGNGGSWEPFALLAFALLLRGRFTRRRG